MNKPKPKHYANLHDDGTVREAPKKIKKPRKPKGESIVKKAERTRKSNALKIRLSEVPTFGAIIDDAMVKRYSGFIYMITMTHKHNPGCKYTYIGKKGFGTGSDWHYYMSSSKKVMERLHCGWEPSYEVISFEGTDADLSRAEGRRIVRQWLHSTDRAANLNMAVVLQGVKWTRYRYCKKYLDVVDRTY